MEKKTNKKTCKRENPHLFYPLHTSVALKIGQEKQNKYDQIEIST